MTAIPYIVICLVLSAFFSGMEVAFMSANRLRIELDKKQGLFSAVIISYFTRKPVEFIATMNIANNIVMVVYGLLIARLLEIPLMHWLQNGYYVFVGQILISTFLMLFTGEFLPKMIFRQLPNFFLNLFSAPVYLVYILLYPITRFLILFSNFFLKRLSFSVKQKDVPAVNVFGKIDLDNLFNNTHSQGSKQLDTEHEIRIFQNALDFSKLKVRDCMVPRTELASINVNSGIESLRKKFIETGFSKILIYEGTIDNIIGYVSSKELFKNPLSIRSKIIKAPIVPETMNTNKLLHILLQEHKSLAVVVDEFGGTSGIVTTEDIMEEIFGEIEDEHDTNERVEKVLEDNAYILSGKLQIDYLNEKFSLGLPEDENYDTLAGFIIHQLGRIPLINESFTIAGFETKVLKTTYKRLEIIYIKKITG